MVFVPRKVFRRAKAAQRLQRFDHFARLIINANHSILGTTEKLCIFIVRLRVGQATDGIASEMRSDNLARQESQARFNYRRYRLTR
jgi:hypothetical protein